MKMESNVSKKAKILAVLFVLSPFIIGMIWNFVQTEYEEIQQEKSREGHDKKYIMVMINGGYSDEYEDSEAAKEYWDEFLEDPYTADALKYLNQYMERIYPDSPYVEVTVEGLAENYTEIADLWNNQLYNYIADKTKSKYTFSREVIKAVGDGRLREVLSLLGYGELTEGFEYGDMSYKDIFLQQSDLESFLDQLNQYINKNHPEIMSEGITVERLEKEPYVENEELVYGQLINAKKQLEAEGVNWETIVQQIHTQMEQNSCLDVDTKKDIKKALALLVSKEPM